MDSNLLSGDVSKVFGGSLYRAGSTVTVSQTGSVEVAFYTCVSIVT
jgi:hypothetical protein